MPLNMTWYNTIKKKDPDFEGSLFQRLGFCDLLCPDCGAHLKPVTGTGGPICLNACHLTPETQERMNSLMGRVRGKDGTE